MSTQNDLPPRIVELLRHVFDAQGGKSGDDAAKHPKRYLTVLLEIMHRNLTDRDGPSTLSSAVEDAACTMSDELYGTGEEEEEGAVQA